MPKTKIPGNNFLEQHCKMQKMKDIDDKHVIVDKDEWEKVVNYLLTYPWLIQKIDTNSNPSIETFEIKPASKFQFKPIDPIRLSLFEAEIVTEKLTPKEKEIFMEQIVSINDTSIKFNQNELDGKIQPMEILSKLLGETFTVNIKVHNNLGKVIGVFTYKDIYLDGFHGMNLDFSYESEDCMLTVEAWIKVSGIFYTTTELKQIKIQ